MTGDPEIPPYLSPTVIATASRVSRTTLMTQLRGLGLLQRMGRLYWVSSTALRERLPDYYERVFEHFEEDRSDDDQN